MSTASKSHRTTRTPGPWRVVGSRLMIYGADDHLITRVYHNKQFAPARAGDAHLIAAAPEMLAALKQLKARVEELSAVKREGVTGAAYDVMTASIGDDITAEFIEAEAAIAKAEGRNHVA